MRSPSRYGNYQIRWEAGGRISDGRAPCGDKRDLEMCFMALWVVLGLLRSSSQPACPAVATTDDVDGALKPTLADRISVRDGLWLAPGWATSNHLPTRGAIYPDRIQLPSNETISLGFRPSTRLRSLQKRPGIARRSSRA